MFIHFFFQLQLFPTNKNIKTMLEMSKIGENYCNIKQTLFTHGKHQMLVSLVTKLTNTLITVSFRNSVNPLKKIIQLQKRIHIYI